MIFQTLKVLGTVGQPVRTPPLKMLLQALSDGGACGKLIGIPAIYAVTLTSKRLCALTKVMLASAVKVSPRVIVQILPLQEGESICDGRIAFGWFVQAEWKALADEMANKATAITLNILNYLTKKTEEKLKI